MIVISCKIRYQRWNKSEWKNLYEHVWNNNNRFIVLKVQSGIESTHGSRYVKMGAYFPYVFLILLRSVYFQKETNIKFNNF